MPADEIFHTRHGAIRLRTPRRTKAEREQARRKRARRHIQAFPLFTQWIAAGPRAEWQIRLRLIALRALARIVAGERPK